MKVKGQKYGNLSQNLHLFFQPVVLEKYCKRFETLYENRFNIGAGAREYSYKCSSWIFSRYILLTAANGPASRSTGHQGSILVLQDVREDDIIDSDAETDSALLMVRNCGNEVLDFKQVCMNSLGQELDPGSKNFLKVFFFRAESQILWTTLTMTLLRMVLQCA